MTRENFAPKHIKRNRPNEAKTFLSKLKKTLVPIGLAAAVSTGFFAELNDTEPLKFTATELVELTNRAPEKILLKYIKEINDPEDLQLRDLELICRSLKAILLDNKNQNLSKSTIRSINLIGNLVLRFQLLRGIPASRTEIKELVMVREISAIIPRKYLSHVEYTAPEFRNLK